MRNFSLWAATWFPLRRPVFNLLSLLCVATVVAWIGMGDERWSKGPNWNEGNPALFAIGNGHVGLVLRHI